MHLKMAPPLDSSVGDALVGTLYRAILGGVIWSRLEGKRRKSCVQNPERLRSITVEFKWLEVKLGPILVFNKFKLF